MRMPLVPRPGWPDSPVPFARGLRPRRLEAKAAHVQPLGLGIRSAFPPVPFSLAVAYLRCEPEHLYRVKPGPSRLSQAQAQALV
jgi:hypothetical protein